MTEIIPRCSWLMLGQEETCCRLAKCEVYCDYHAKQKVKSFPCMSCGKGTRSSLGVYPSTMIKFIIEYSFILKNYPRVSEEVIENILSNVYDKETRSFNVDRIFLKNSTNKISIKLNELPNGLLTMFYDKLNDEKKRLNKEK